MARRMGVRVERFAIGFGKKILGFKRGNTEYLINIFPVGGYVKLAGEDPNERKGKPYEFYSKPIISRFWIVFSGPLANYLLALLMLWLIFIIGIPTLTTKVGDILKDSPAYKAGIKKGDRIISIDGKAIKYWGDLLEIVQNDVEGKPLSIDIKRDEDLINRKIAPEVIEAENIFKQKIKIGRLGIAASEETEVLRVNPARAVVEGTRRVIFLTVSTYKGIWFMVTGTLPVKENVRGFVGIVEHLSEAVRHGPVTILFNMAYISLILAIVNLLPFPILDGGHILFLIIEKIRKRPLNTRAQELISQVALALLIAFLLYVTYFDAARLVNRFIK